MDTLDLTTVGGVVVATWFMVGVLGKMGGTPWLAVLGALVKANQELAAIVCAVGLTCAVKAAGIGFETVAWPQAILQAFVAALAAGLSQDKIAKPTTRLLK